MNLGWRTGTQVHSLADEPGAKSEDEELKGETEGGILDCLVCVKHPCVGPWTTHFFLNPHSIQEVSTTLKNMLRSC